MKYVTGLIFLIFSVSKLTAQIQQKEYAYLMGSNFSITVVAEDSIKAQYYIKLAKDEISRIEGLISEWSDTTEIGKVNKFAGICAVKVAPEVLHLTQRAISYSKWSDGAFDISIAALDKVWKFDGSMESKPSDELIRHSIRKVAYSKIVIDTIASTIYLKERGMKIGFGSIGKGYAADRARTILQEQNVAGGIIDASGDLATWGSQYDGKQWKIGIKNPQKDFAYLKVLQMYQGAVATSGSYEKYVYFDGIRYSHIINPNTGFPAQGITSVTVLGPSAEVANGLSTSIMVLGWPKAIAYLKAFPNYKVWLQLDNGKMKKWSFK